ncbi:MAG: hypothetical protein EBT13_05755 [Rhodobacteraceae bacterium]|nr:hypothetical protein [Paracoccaceae bacterium]
MIRKTLTAMTFGFLALAIAGGAQAKSLLKDVVEIQERLIVIGIAYRIDERCDSLSIRDFRKNTALLGVANRAMQLGYTRAEITAYIDDKVEKDRLVTVAEGRLAEMGAVEGQPQTFCRVGQEQITAGTDIGRLLR